MRCPGRNDGDLGSTHVLETAKEEEAAKAHDLPGPREPEHSGALTDLCLGAGSFPQVVQTVRASEGSSCPPGQCGKKP